MSDESSFTCTNIAQPRSMYTNSGDAVIAAVAIKIIRDFPACDTYIC